MQNILELADPSFPITTISYTIEFVLESTEYDNIDNYQKKIFQIIQNSTINYEFVKDFNTLVNTIAINNKYCFHIIISTSVKNLGFNSEILKSFAPTFLRSVAPTFISNISNKSYFLIPLLFLIYLMIEISNIKQIISTPRDNYLLS